MGGRKFHVFCGWGSSTTQRIIPDLQSISGAILICLCCNITAMAEGSQDRLHPRTKDPGATNRNSSRGIRTSKEPESSPAAGEGRDSTGTHYTSTSSATISIFSSESSSEHLVSPEKTPDPNSEPVHRVPTDGGTLYHCRRSSLEKDSQREPQTTSQNHSLVVPSSETDQSTQVMIFFSLNIINFVFIFMSSLFYGCIRLHSLVVLASGHLNLLRGNVWLTVNIRFWSTPKSSCINWITLDHKNTNS